MSGLIRRIKAEIRFFWAAEISFLNLLWARLTGSLPPPKLTCRLADHLAPWKGREIWLEAAMECRSYCITEAGCVSHPGTIDHFPFWNDELCCRYRIDLSDNAACFTLCRNRDDLSTLLDQAAAFGVTRGIGLWQELS